ncbi:sulfotransferase 1C4 [Elysia marginata]|uniref:Sulfotransferase 1C4 n=1 Tax=Elysia marginata TaxID=1093978 RepID=A0AAV4FF75_9GAST|nr:sulfotransferase 1C4 [Elysia marginata]
MSSQGHTHVTEQVVNNDTTSGQGSEFYTNQETFTSSSSNPHHFPERQLFKGLTYNGVPVLTPPWSGDPIKHVKRIRNLSMKEDDILIAAFHKCGTHWVSEMLNMLLSGSTDYSSRCKEFAMLEFIENLTLLDQMTSPRVLNSHLYTAHLPEQMLAKRVKLVHLIRNPKDCAVSLYHHWTYAASDQFTFDSFLKGYITEGYTTVSHQPNYLRQMAQFQKDNPDHPIIHIHYEDLKKDPVPILQELARFVGVEASQKFCQDVASACGFEKLKQADGGRDLPSALTKAVGKGFTVYRKGVVGDWKDTFTVAQSEMFDQFIARQEEKGLHYDFRWQ